MSPPSFSEKTAEDILVKSGRFCPLCLRFRGIKIEVHHIDQNGGNEEDNGIALCFDCHSEVGIYNPKHPKGRRYRHRELKRRRDALYEIISRGEKPVLPDLPRKSSRASMKHSKYLLHVLHESADYRTHESMITHNDYFINYIESERTFKHLLKHLETGYPINIYSPLVRYMKLVEHYRSPDYGIPFYFSHELPKEILEEVDEVRTYLAEAMGELIEDVYDHGIPIKGWCTKCT